MAYGRTLAASGGDGTYSWALSDGDLPGGLALDVTTAELSGIPASPGDFAFTVVVTSGAQAVEQPLSITVEATLAVTTASLPDIVAGSASQLPLEAAGGNGTYAWTLLGGPLPEGLTLDTTNGEISGTPTTPGIYDFTVRVESGAQIAQQGLSVTVLAALIVTTTALPDGVVDLDYGTYSLTASGGDGSYSWALAAGSGPLPTGLTLAANGDLSGTPTAMGTFDLTVAVTSGGQSAQRALSVDINETIAVTTGTLPDGVESAVYPTQTLTAIGGAATYTWALATGSGPLPDGLTLSADGEIAGTTSASGTFGFTVEVTSGTLNAQQGLAITVQSALGIATAGLPDGVVGSGYGPASLAGTGGLGTYSWDVASGSDPPPPGLALAENGELTGTPTTTGNFDFTVEVTSGPATLQRGFSITVHTALSVTTTTLPLAIEDVGYGTETLVATGGDGTYGWALAPGSGPLPDGITLSSTGQISGIPTVPGTFDFTVEVTSAAGGLAQQGLSITVHEVLNVDTSSLPAAIEAIDYGVQSLAGSGGDGTYTWALANGSGPLPDGLSLAPNGDITGTPTVPGTFGFTVEAESGDGQAASRTLAIVTIEASNLAQILVDSITATFECAYSAFGLVALGHEDVFESIAGVGAAMHVYRATPRTGACDNTSTTHGWYDEFMVARSLGTNAGGTGLYDRLADEWTSPIVPDRERLMAISALYNAAAYDHFGAFYCEMAFDDGALETPTELLDQAEAWADAAVAHVASNGDFAMPGGVATSADDMARALRARIRWANGDLMGAADDAALVPDGFSAFVTRDAGVRRRNKIYDAGTAVGYSGMLGVNDWWTLPTPNPATGNAWPSPIPFTGYIFLGVMPDGRTLEAGDLPVRWAAEIRDVNDDPIPLGNGAVADTRVAHHIQPIQGPIPEEVPDKYLSEADDIPLVTWREMRLIQAENENETGSPAGAIAQVNALRSSAGLPTISDPYLSTLTDGSNDFAEVRAVIIEERRREFFAEAGRYWATKIQNTDVLWFPRGEGQTPFQGYALQGGVRLFMPTLEYEDNPNLTIADRGTGCTSLFGSQQPVFLSF